MSKLEIRTFSTESIIEERAEGKGLKLSGVAIPYDTWSDGLNFREKFSSGAFNESLRKGDNIFSFWNHNRDHVLGRTSNKTLRIEDSDKALRYEVDLPSTTYAKDLHELVKRGDVAGTSIGFRTVEDEWGEDEQGYWRVVKRAILTETSPEITPAYSNTDVAIRSMEEFRSSQEPEVKEDFKSTNDNLRIELDLLEIE